MKQFGQFCFVWFFSLIILLIKTLTVTCIYNWYLLEITNIKIPFINWFGVLFLVNIFLHDIMLALSEKRIEQYTAFYGGEQVASWVLKCATILLFGYLFTFLK